MVKATSVRLSGLILVLVCGSFAVAAESSGNWGSLKGRFVVDGNPAAPAPVKITKDDFYCGKKKPVVNESIVIGKNNALVNAVVYLRPPLGKQVEIHPDYAAKMKQPVELDNHFCMFSPHIVMVRLGQTLTIKNSDPPPIGHNTKIELFSFNQTIASLGQAQIVANKDFAIPMPIECNIHPWMKAHVVCLKHPYMAASGQYGSFEIKDIPAGTNEFQFWHEASGFLKSVKYKGGAADTRGRAKIAISPGQTADLGDITVPARLLVPN